MVVIINIYILSYEAWHEYVGGGPRSGTLHTYWRASGTRVLYVYVYVCKIFICVVVVYIQALVLCVCKRTD